MPSKRATALGIYALGIPIGILFGNLAGGWIDEFFGWRYAFFVVGIPGILLAILLRVTVREPPRGHTETTKQTLDQVPFSVVVKTMWQKKSFRHMSLGAATQAFVGYGAIAWMPMFLVRSHDMSSGEVGTALGMPEEMVYRQPFPGPGLAIRIPGKITKDKVDILKEADFIFINELKKSNLYNKIWQAYAALLPLKTVGVMGDSRTYEYTCLLRAVTSEDGMTADFFSFNKDFVQKVSNKIINSVNGINRVVYDVTSKPPSTIELE